MAHRWKTSFLVLFLWYAVFAFGFWASIGFPPDGYTWGLTDVLDFFRFSPIAQEWIVESYDSNISSCPPTLFCLAFLAWCKKLPKSSLGKIGLFFFWQVGITLLVNVTSQTGILFDGVIDLVSHILSITYDDVLISHSILVSFLTFAIVTLPINIAALWYCLFHLPKSNIELPEQPTTV